MENSSTLIANEEPKKDGTYKVDNVLLIESNFVRTTGVEILDVPISNEIKISHDAHETSLDRKFGVTLTLEYSGKQNDSVVCNSIIKMFGVFEIYGEPQLKEETFKKINAPAILYPFIREHLHSICLKAGLSKILLPTVNFKI